MNRKKNKSRAEARVRAALCQKGELVESACAHVCETAFCRPQNEVALNLPGPPLDDSVYVCRYGQVHVCTEDECENVFGGTCALSGRSHANHTGMSSYDKNDYRTWNSGTHTARHYGANAKRQRIKPLEPRVTQVITTLLYSPVRNDINKHSHKAYAEIFKRKVAQYVQENEMPSIIQIEMMEEKYKNHNEKIPIIAYDHDAVERYTALILRTYSLVKQYSLDPSKLETVAVGVLYMLRQGFVAEGRTLFEIDSFLLHNLPSPSDLPRFGYQKSSITKGKHQIQNVYNNLLREGVITRAWETF